MQKLPEESLTRVLKWERVKMKHTRKRGQVKPVVSSTNEDKMSAVPVKVRAMVWKEKNEGYTHIKGTYSLCSKARAR